MLQKNELCNNAVAICFAVVLCFFAVVPHRSSTPAFSPLEESCDRIFSERLLSGSVLVKQDDRILLQKSYGWADPGQKIPNGPCTKYNIGSCTKQMTGFLLIQLEKEGKLNPSSRLDAILPELVNTEIGSVTLEQLLQMTGGVPNLLKPWAYVSVQLFAKNWSAEDLLQEIRSYELEFEPGTQFRYSNLSYVLLGIAIERVSGMSWERMLEERIFIPFQMADTQVSKKQTIANLAKPFLLAHRFLFCGGIVYYPMPQWNYSALKGAGGVVSTCADLSRWQQALKQFALDEPKWAERYFGGGGPGNYAYGWVHEEVQGKNIRFHGGETPGYCALILFDSSSRVEVVLLLNSDFVLFDNMDELTYRIAKAIQ